MATRTWLGRATARKQVTTLTVTGPIVAGETFSVHIGGGSAFRTIVFTATATTTSNVVTGLVALLTASTAPAEFKEGTWTGADPTITFTNSDAYAGVPVTITVSHTSAAGNFTAAATTVPTGPSHVDNVNNWTGGVLPADGDTVIFEKAAVGPKYALTALASVTPALLEIQPFATYDVGLARVNVNGGYTEYRDRYLQFDGCTLFRMPDSGGTGSGLIRLDFLSAVAYTAQIDTTGSSTETGMPTVNLLGGHADEALEVNGGSVGVAMVASETATVKTINMANGTLDLGPGVTANGAGSAFTIYDGDFTCRTAMVTCTVRGGTARNYGSGTVTTLTIHDGATFYLNSSGTVTTCNLYGTLDVTEDISGRTITTLNARAAASIEGMKNLTVGTWSLDVGIDSVEFSA